MSDLKEQPDSPSINEMEGLEEDTVKDGEEDGTDNDSDTVQANDDDDDDDDDEEYEDLENNAPTVRGEGGVSKGRASDMKLGDMEEVVENILNYWRRKEAALYPDKRSDTANLPAARSNGTSDAHRHGHHQRTHEAPSQVKSRTHEAPNRAIPTPGKQIHKKAGSRLVDDGDDAR